MLAALAAWGFSRLHQLQDMSLPLGVECLRQLDQTATIWCVYKSGARAEWIIMICQLGFEQRLLRKIRHWDSLSAACDCAQTAMGDVARDAGEKELQRAIAV